jgi:hypothetical protein
MTSWICQQSLKRIENNQDDPVTEYAKNDTLKKFDKFNAEQNTDSDALVFCVVFCRSLFVLLATVLSVFLRFTDSGYPSGIF